MTTEAGKRPDGWWVVHGEDRIGREQFAAIGAGLQEATTRGEQIVVLDGITLEWVQNPDRIAKTVAAERARIRAAVEGMAGPLCRGSDVCDIHAELLYGDRCEDFPAWLPAVLALLEETP
jgi:hypothetical protein